MIKDDNLDYFYVKNKIVIDLTLSDIRGLLE